MSLVPTRISLLVFNEEIIFIILKTTYNYSNDTDVIQGQVIPPEELLCTLTKVCGTTIPIASQEHIESSHSTKFMNSTTAFISCQNFWIVSVGRTKSHTRRDEITICLEDPPSPGLHTYC